MYFYYCVKNFEIDWFHCFLELYCVSQHENSQWDLSKTPGVWRAWAQFRGFATEQSMIPQKETCFFHYFELLVFGSFIFLIHTQCVRQLVSFLKLDLTVNDSSFTRNIPYTTETGRVCYQ